MSRRAPPWALIAALAAGLAYFLFSRSAAASTVNGAPGPGAAAPPATGDDFAPLAFEGRGDAPSKLQKLDFGFLAAVAASIRKFRDPLDRTGAGIMEAPGLAGAASSPSAPSGGGFVSGGGFYGGGGGGSRGTTQVF